MTKHDDQVRHEEDKHENTHAHTHGEKVVCKGTPTSIKCLLEMLLEDEVVIILKSGEQETVEVEAVVGNLLVATLPDDRIKFIDIDCICVVIAECEDIIEAVLGFGCGSRES